MQATVSQTARDPALVSHERRLKILGALMVACVISTAAHYTHNYVEIRHYPQSDLIGSSMIRLAIVISWPVLTALGVFGYWLYAHRRYVAAYPMLALYSLLGFAILAFAHWSAVMGRETAPRRETAI